MAGLIMRKGPSPGVRFPLLERLILGRHSGADVVVQDPGASRRHAAIVARAGAFRILDLGSTNGTLLNNSPIEGEASLNEGDLIQIGEEVFEFVLEESPVKEPPTVSLATVGLDRPQHGPAEPGAANEGLPRQMGKFVLLSHLGRGGMGDVYRARERGGGPEVAIKVIRSEIGNRESFLDYFHNREAVLAREIDHPNVIKILEHGASGDQHFIAMEYVAGETLQDRIKRGPVGFQEALEIIRQVACGLAAAHRRGVVHSDIKPGNIMILSEAAPPAGTGGPQEESSVELEFPDHVLPGGPRRYEGALKEEIRRRLGDPSPVHRELLLDPPYFPRASEMRFLQHYWESLEEGSGHFIVVAGEPGSGKDRLLSEFIKERGLAGSVSSTFIPPPARLFEFDASRIEGIPQLYQRLLPDRAPRDRASREAVLEILRALGGGGHPGEPPLEGGGPSRLPAAEAGAASGSAAAAEPVVVRVLGIEEASPIGCELLQGLLRLIPRRPILVLAALDPASLPRNTPLSQLLTSAGGRVKELYLRPLSRYQLGRYLQDLFREPLRQDRLADDLHRLTHGNFARLLWTVRSFFDRGLLKLDRLAGRVVYQPSPREFELAEGKQLYERYRRYGKMEQRVLEHAAFIGPEFLFDTLLRFAELDETAVFFIVRDLHQQGFLSELSRTWYRFQNQAFQRYLAERVSARERPRLHRKVAWLLDEAPLGASPELLRLRAHHWEKAGEQAKAVRLLLQGAQLARNEYDIEHARRMYQEMLRIYRDLASDGDSRRAVTDELKAWFQRDANWYEVLGSLGEESMRVRVKITDFGISFRVREEDGFWMDQRVPLGTPRYLAPERVRREPGGPKSDIFALGIIAHEILSGSPPFPGKKGLEVMRANLEREIPAPVVAGSEVPPEFFDLYRGMVEKDAELRWDAERVLRTIAKMQLDLLMDG
jgi:serine/threonine protein kinase